MALRIICKRNFKTFLLLIACVGIAIAVINSVKQRHLSEVYQRLKERNLSIPLQYLLRSAAESRDEDASEDVVAEKLECPIIDFFTSVDPTAVVYDPDLLCDEFAEKSDIICRMHLRQIGLEHLEKSACTLQMPEKVPRIVYFIIFGSYDFKFVHYVAVMAAKRHVSPSAIYVIGDQHPVGKWWQKVLRDVDGVRFLFREVPTNISNKSIPFKQHLSDIVRLQVMYMNGGIYLDADMLVLRDLTPLLDYDVTLGMLDKLTGMGNAFIMAKRGSPFIREWYAEYSHYRREWGWNSLKVPQKMWLKNSSRVHMESERLYRPNWFENYLLFNRSDYPWRNNYACHVWSKKTPLPRSLDDVQTSNTTVAQIFRHVLYGDSRPRTYG